MKYLTPIFILIFSFSVFGQAEKCTLKASQIPTIRGLRLYMSKAQILKVYPNSRFGDQPLDLFDSAESATLQSKQITNPALAKNIEKIVMFINAEKALSRVTFYYDDSILWPSPSEFIEQSTKTFGIDPKLWKPLSSNNSYYVLCADFDLSITVQTGKANLTLNVAIDEIIKNQDKRKKGFKP